ncbi:titin homolog isoform X5 [Cydia splendana]|uniref:titin homolog isoform X5 n=1 Tax=Cydia splendana TaxID=1100963 RepID=UPI00300CCABD
MGRAYSSSKVHVTRGRDESRPSSAVTPEPPPIFTKELEDQFVKICEHLTLSCHIVVPPWPRSVVWYNKEGKIEPGERYHATEDGVGGYLLEVQSAEWPDGGEWKCVATSAGGRVGISTCHVVMDVPKNYRKPRFMENLQAVLTDEGLVSFECKVVGFPTPVLSWFKDGQELKPGDVYQLTGTNSLGSYCCIARNCMGQASSSAELTVEDIQNQLNEDERLQLFTKHQAPKFVQGLQSSEARIDEPFHFTIKVAIPPEPTVLWYRDDQPVDESPRCHLAKEDRGIFTLDIKNLEFLDQAEWKCVAMNEFGHSVTSCFLKLIIPRHFKKPRFLENLQAILSEEGAVNLECKVIGVPQPVLKWYKDGEELKPGDIHRIISGQDGTCCLGTYTCEAQNCMGIAASSASLLGFDDSMKAKKKIADEQALQRNLSLSTIHEERTSQMYDTPVGDITLDDKGEISFSFDGKEVSVSLYETPDLTEEEALQIVEMYADQLSENVTEHNVVELPPLRFVKETSTSGNLLMEAIIIDVSPEYFASPEEDLRTEADVEDISIADENGAPQLSLDTDLGEDYLEKTMALLSDEKSDMPKKTARKKSDSLRSGEDFFSLSREQSISEDKRDDDTQVMSESDLASFASARSYGKHRSKSSRRSIDDGRESSETKTILHKVDVEEVREVKSEMKEIKTEIQETEQKRAETETPVMKPKRERRSSRGSRRSSSGSEKSYSKAREELLQVRADVEPKPKMTDEEFKSKVTEVSSTISKVINDVQIIERDIILKSELMSSAATASRSLEIISSLITPLSEIHSISEAAKESLQAKEVTTIFNNLPQSMKALQQSLTIVEKCIDVESENKTLVKKTCVAFIETCGNEIQKVMSDINSVTLTDYLQADESVIREIQTLTKEMTNVIKYSSDTIKTRNLLNEASEIKTEETSIDAKHLKDTQKAVFELRSPVNSLLCIAESAESGKMIDVTKIKNSEVILNDMSASIQDLQVALEQIESLSVKESTTSLNKYNTEIIETVMDSVLKLRMSFEQLSTETRSEDDKLVLKQALTSIKQTLSEISTHIDKIESNVGRFDILQSDNKLEVLQKMAQILIALENNLPRLECLPDVKLHLDLFHKNLTKVLENVIESNEAKKYFSLTEICDVVNRVNAAMKIIDSDSILSLASLNNTMRIVQDHFINNIFDSELNCATLSNISDVLVNIQEAINQADEVSLHIDSEHIITQDISSYETGKAVVALERIEHTIAAINKVRSLECAQELKDAITPVLENVCPVLEELKRSVASIASGQVEQDENVSEMSDVQSVVHTLATPLCELNENIMVINQTIVEHIESLKENSEVFVTVAEPLHELHTTLETLQQVVISQYGEDVTPYEVSVNMANAVQNLHSCIIMIREQGGVEIADEMSTLEDISGIKTTADTLPSDRLVLPEAAETTAEHAVSSLHQDIVPSATAQALQSLNDHITVLQNPDVIDALDTLSEVSDYSSLKSVALGLGELHSGIQEILHPFILETSDEMAHLNTSKLMAIAEPMQDLQQCLSVLDVTNIPIYEHILEMASDKIHSVFQNIAEFKENLDKCIHAVFPAMETADKTIEISNKVESLRAVCEHLKDIIENTKAISTEAPVKEEVIALEETVNNLLDATDVSKGIKIEQVKSVTQELYENVINVQEELIQFTSQAPEKLAQEANLIQVIDKVERNIAVLEEYDFVDLSRASDMSCASPQIALEIETDALIQMDDVVQCAVGIIQDSSNETPVADLMMVEDFFKNCKNEFALLRCLLTKKLSHKRIIRLLQEFNALKQTINDFKVKQNELHLAEDISNSLNTFFGYCNESLNSVQDSLIMIVDSQSDLLFKAPITKLDATKEVLSEILASSKFTPLEDVAQRFVNIIEIAKPCLQRVETVIHEEIKFNATVVEDKALLAAMDDAETFIEEQILTKSELTVESREILQKVLDCIQKHHDYKDATGTGKTLILLKCLAECSDILQESMSESKLEIKEHKFEDTALKNVLAEMLAPLQALHHQLLNIQEQVSTGMEDEVVSVDLTSTESFAQAMGEIQQDIKQLEQHVSEGTVVDSAEKTMILELDKEIHTIQDSINSIENVTSEDKEKVSKPMAEIEKSLKTLLETESKAAAKDKTPGLLQSVDKYIELIEIVEEISTIMNIDNVNESAKLAQELRESVVSSQVEQRDATKELSEESREISMQQAIIAMKLKDALTSIQVQVIESTKELEPELKNQVVLRIEQAAEQLQDLATLAEVHAEEPKPIEVSAESNKTDTETREGKFPVEQIVTNVTEDVKTETAMISEIKQLDEAKGIEEMIMEQVDSEKARQVEEDTKEVLEKTQVADEIKVSQKLDAAEEIKPAPVIGEIFEIITTEQLSTIETCVSIIIEGKTDQLVTEPEKAKLVEEEKEAAAMKEKKTVVSAVELVQRIDEYLTQDLEQTDLAGDINEKTKIVNIANELRETLNVAETSEQVELMRELHDLVIKQTEHVSASITDVSEQSSNVTIRLCETLASVIDLCQKDIEKQEEITELTKEELSKEIGKEIEETILEEISKDTTQEEVVCKKSVIERIDQSSIEESQQMDVVEHKIDVTAVDEEHTIKGVEGEVKPEQDQVTESHAAEVNLMEPPTETHELVSPEFASDQLAATVDSEQNKFESASAGEKVIIVVDDKKVSQPEPSAETSTSFIELKDIAPEIIEEKEQVLAESLKLETSMDSQKEEKEITSVQVKQIEDGSQELSAISTVEPNSEVQEAISTPVEVTDDKIIASKAAEISEVAPDEVHDMETREVKKPQTIEPVEVTEAGLEKPDVIEAREVDTRILPELQVVEATEETIRDLVVSTVEDNLALATSIETLVTHLDEFIAESCKTVDVFVMNKELEESLSLAKLLEHDLKDKHQKEVVNEIGEQQIKLSIELKEALNRIEIVALENVGDGVNTEELIKKVAEVMDVLRSDLDGIIKISQVAIQDTETNGNDQVVPHTGEENQIHKEFVAESAFAEQTVATADHSVENVLELIVDNDEPVADACESKIKPGELPGKPKDSESEIIPEKSADIHTAELQKEKANDLEIKEIVIPSFETFMQHINEYVSENVSDILHTLSNIVQSEAMTQSITIAKEVQESYHNIENIQDLDKKTVEKIEVLEKLQNALVVLQAYTNDATEDLKSNLGEGLSDLAKLATHLSADLESVVSQAKLVLSETTTDNSTATHVVDKISGETTSEDFTEKQTSKDIHRSDKLEKNYLSEQLNSQDQPKSEQPVLEVANISENAPTASEAESVDQVASLELLTTSVGEATERLAAILTQSIRDEELQNLEDQNESQPFESIACVNGTNLSAIDYQVHEESVTTAIKTGDMKDETTETKVKMPIETATLVQHIDELTSASIAETVEVLSKFIDVSELKESIAVANELKDSFIEVEKVKTEEVSKEQAKLVEKLQGALEAFQAIVVENTENIVQNLDVNEWAKVTEVVTHLQDDLARATITEPTTEMAGESMHHLETLLQEVTDKIGTTERSSDDTESLRDNLDEIQTVIIKLKRDYDGASNDTLNETLEDLECSVRSVQLQITEDSPPELLQEACATLQLLVNNMSATGDITGTVVKEVKTDSLLEKCSDETEATVKLLNIAIENKGDLSKIVENLNVLRDVMQLLRNNFLKDADTLIDKGVEVIQSLDQVEEKVFALEKDIVEIPESVKESIFNAVHSVYSSISNMRSTVQSIQKRYMYDNYGKPSESILKAIKNVQNKDYNNFSKSLRKVLNHFEDIKFYINLDKTARLPSDAAFTKIILNELKLTINENVTPHSISSPEVTRTYLAAIKGIKSNLNKIESLTTLEVKQKIPIFKDIATLLLKMTDAIAKSSEIEDIVLEDSVEVKPDVETHEKIEATQLNDLESNKLADTVQLLESTTEELKVIDQQIDHSAIRNDAEILVSETTDSSSQLKITAEIVAKAETDTTTTDKITTEESINKSLKEVSKDNVQEDTATLASKGQEPQTADLSLKPEFLTVEPQPSTSKQEDTEPLLSISKEEQSEKRELAASFEPSENKTQQGSLKADASITKDHMAEIPKPEDKDIKEEQRTDVLEKKEEEPKTETQEPAISKTIKSLKPKKDEETQTDDEEEVIKDLTEKTQETKIQELKTDQDIEKALSEKASDAELQVSTLDKSKETEISIKKEQEDNKDFLQAQKPIPEKEEVVVKQKNEQEEENNKVELSQKEQLKKQQNYPAQEEREKQQDMGETEKKVDIVAQQEVNDSEPKETLEKKAEEEQKEPDLKEGQQNKEFKLKTEQFEETIQPAEVVKETISKEEAIEDSKAEEKETMHEEFRETDTKIEQENKEALDELNKVDDAKPKETKDRQTEEQVDKADLDKQQGEKEAKLKQIEEAKEALLKKQEEEKEAKLKAKQEKKEAKLKKIQEDKEAKLKKEQEEKDAIAKQEQGENEVRLKREQDEKEAKLRAEEEKQKQATLDKELEKMDTKVKQEEEDAHPTEEHGENEKSLRKEQENKEAGLKQKQERDEKTELREDKLKEKQEEHEASPKQTQHEHVTDLKSEEEKGSEEAKLKIGHEEKIKIEQECNETSVQNVIVEQKENLQIEEEMKEDKPKKEQEEKDSVVKTEQETIEAAVKKDTKELKAELKLKEKESNLKIEQEENAKIEQEKKEAVVRKEKEEQEAELKVEEEKKEAKLKKEQKKKDAKVKAEEEEKFKKEKHDAKPEEDQRKEEAALNNEGLKESQLVQVKEESLNKETLEKMPGLKEDQKIKDEEHKQVVKKEKESILEKQDDSKRETAQDDNETKVEDQVHKDTLLQEKQEDIENKSEQNEISKREAELKTQEKKKEITPETDQEKQDTKPKQDEKEAQLKKDQEENDANLRAEEEEKQARLRKEHEENEIKLKKEQEEKEVQIKKEQEEREAQLKKEQEEQKIKLKQIQEAKEALLKQQEEEKEAKLKAKQEKKEAKLKKIQEDKEAKLKKEQEEKDAKLKQEQEEKEAQLKKEQEEKEAVIKEQEQKEANLKKEREEKEAKLKAEKEEKEAKLRKEQDEKDTKLKLEEEKKEASLKKEQEEKEAKLKSEKEENEARLKKEQDEKEAKLKLEEENKEATLKAEKEEKDAQLKKEQADKNAKLKAEEEKKEASLKKEQEEKEAKLKAEKEEKDAKLKKERAELDAKVKVEEEKKKADLKKEQEEAEQRQKEAQLKKEKEENDAKLKLEQELREAKLKKEQEEEDAKQKAKQERKKAKLEKIQKDKEAKLKKEQEEKDAKLTQEQDEREVQLKKERDEKEALLKSEQEEKTLKKDKEEQDGKLIKEQKEETKVEKEQGSSVEIEDKKSVKKSEAEKLEEKRKEKKREKMEEDHTKMAIKTAQEEIDEKSKIEKDKNKRKQSASKDDEKPMLSDTYKTKDEKLKKGESEIDIQRKRRTSIDKDYGEIRTRNTRRENGDMYRESQRDDISSYRVRKVDSRVKSDSHQQRHDEKRTFVDYSGKDYTSETHLQYHRDDEKRRFVDHSSRDYTSEFARPSNYREKTYEPDNFHVDTIGKGMTIYKAQTLVLDAELRSGPLPDLRSSVPRLDSRRSEPTERRTELRHKTKAVSEARSVLSEKRSSMPRDVRRKPVFSTYLTDRTAVEGSRVKLTCSVLSSAEPTITWYKNGVLIDNKLKYRTKFIDGLVTLEVMNAIPADSAEYNCTVENENGSVSSTATLKVYPSFEASPIPPTFTRSIRDTYHLAENELVLECRIRGQPLPTITWLKDDQPITDDRYQAYYLADGVCRIAISRPVPEDGGKYTCKAENSVWCDQITHVVSFTGKETRLSPNIHTIERSRFTRQAMESRRPHFTNVLTDYKVARGGTIGLQVEIRGCPTRVEWLREGKSVTDVYRNAKTYVEQGLYTLALSDVTEKETGLYTCRAWSMHGNVDMNAAITVVHPELDGKPAIIVGRPEKDVLISVGEDLNISFRVQGDPKPKVVFMKGTRDITNSQRVCKMTSDDYVKFTVKRSVVSDAGTYCIFARNAYGCDRAFVTVVVRQRASSENLISDWTYPLDDSAISYGSRTYDTVPRIPSEPSVVDGGNNWVSLAWPKPDTTTPVLAYKVESWLLGKEGGARWTELGITPRNCFDVFNLKQGEQYHFRVTLRNRYGWGESVQTSTPIGVGLTGDRPEFVDILPGQLKVLIGTTANLSCSVKGKPVPEVVWMRNGQEIEDERMRASFNGYDCRLVISDIREDDEARYSCEASNEHGRSSTYARLSVVTDKLLWEADAKLKRERSSDVSGDYPPQFTMRLRDRRVQATYPVRLTCQVVGCPTPSVTWYKDGEEVYKDNRHTHFKDELFHTLEIAPCTLEDGGVYSCTARNSSGAVSCRCSLVVDKGIRAYVAPELCCGLDPLYRLREGDELRITAVVEAYPSVGVTWYRDGIRLRPSRRAVMTLDRDGQIELALASVTARDAGVYTCTAANEVGSASTSGKVEVIEGPVVEKRAPPTLVGPDVPYSKEPMFIRKPRSSEAYEGDTVIIECEVTGDPKPDVYWLRDFLKPDYYRDASHFKRVGAGPEYRFEIPHAKLDYTGAYSVVARNVHGEAKAIISLQILAKDLTSGDDSHNVRYGRVDVIPRFERNLNDLLSYDGDAVEFECRVSGHPEPDIRWYHYAELIRDCPYLECTLESGAARLKIKQVTADDEGTYTCEAYNNLGKASTSACLVVYPPGEPNTLSARLRRPLSAVSTPRSTPRSTPARSLSRTTTPAPDMKRQSSPSRQTAPSFYTYPFNKVVEEGETVVFQCAVKGLPSPWATWDKDGVIVTPSSRITIKEKDEIRKLEIEHVTIEDVGLYRISIENDYGRAEGTARLEVITQNGKFHAGVRAYSASPRRSAPYRKTTTSISKD